MFRAIDHACQALRQTHCGWFAGLIGIWLCIFSAMPRATAAVRVIQRQPSSPHPRIVVQFEGKPFANAKVEIFREPDSSGEASFTVVTDQSGLAQIPTLPTGKYRFLVSAEPKLLGDLYLLVSPSVSASASRFTIDLQCCAPPSYEEIVASAERQATQDTLQSFQGVLKDQSGAVIPNVAIDVVIRGTKGRIHAAKVFSGIDGKFSKPLEDGQYIAFFRATGFSVDVVPFTISRRNGSGELRVTLKVGTSS